ncbi:hypothetical protein MIMGU_mgv1a024024mg [Erythranthe guttata]|uniref:Serine-rich protein-like protein n=1 Tax=Erythranthe guttata TaxID=4155 RepID=A0A022R7U2_ERYGU|nr:hypothetical protein MIMGU_mgv1a024024mg [Erythranthe guttata]
MAAYTPRRSSGPVLRSTALGGGFNRHAATPSSSSPCFASATSSAFTTAAQTLRRPSVNLPKYTSPSLSLSFDRPGSPNRSNSVSTRAEKPPPAAAAAAAARRRTCMCSPTNHPGSFRCSLHKGGLAGSGVVSGGGPARTVSCGSSSGLNMRRSAMKNSLVRIGTVEGELEKRALAALIRPSSHQQRRRGEFRPRPSRLSVMSRNNRSNTILSNRVCCVYNFEFCQ